MHFYDAEDCRLDFFLEINANAIHVQLLLLVPAL